MEWTQRHKELNPQVKNLRFCLTVVDTAIFKHTPVQYCRDRARKQKSRLFATAEKQNSFGAKHQKKSSILQGIPLFLCYFYLHSMHTLHFYLEESCPILQRHCLLPQQKQLPQVVTDGPWEPDLAPLSYKRFPSGHLKHRPAHTDTCFLSFSGVILHKDNTKHKGSSIPRESSPENNRLNYSTRFWSHYSKETRHFFYNPK